LSKSEQYPTPNKNDRISSGNIPITVTKNDYSSLAGTYYLAVLGHEYSYYYVRPLITYQHKNGTVKKTYIKL
jgi:hypothetical protein